MLKQIKANINASDKKCKLYEMPNLKHDISFLLFTNSENVSQVPKAGTRQSRKQVSSQIHSNKNSITCQFYIQLKVNIYFNLTLFS